MNRQELLSRIIHNREELEATLAKFSDERMEMVILHGEWSVKDLIGHLGFWENRAVSLFSALRNGVTPEVSQDMDALNAKALVEFRSLPLGDVKSFEKAAYQKILGLLQEASDQELFDPKIFTWLEGRSFVDVIADNTWAHYEEHLPEMFQWLKRIA